MRYRGRTHRPVRRRLILVACAAQVAAALAGVSGCGNGEPSGVADAASIPFETVAHEATVGSGPDGPNIYVAASASGLGSFERFLTDADREQLGAVDFSRHLVVAALRGQVPTGGYEITIREITLAGSRLEVVVSVREPAPDEYAITAFTSPYHVVSVARAGLTMPPTSWVLVNDSGKTLARGNAD